MENMRVQFLKWKRKKSTHKYTRLEAFPDQLFNDKQTTLKTEEESLKCINHVRCKSHTSNNYGNTAMNDGECNWLMKIIQIYILN